MCQELDRQIGSIHKDILAHENRIIQRLSGYVLKYQQDIRRPLKIIALIDCLIALSKVAIEKGFVRPSLNEESVHEIEDGTSPLLEMQCDDFVPNSFYSGQDYSRVKIITGPNASGKSVYLKQTALIIFLAHVGSFVPAKAANIGLVHSFYTRVYASESAAIEMSSFMLDLSQLSLALNNAKRTSLLLIDEFGRGTDGEDGFALLGGLLTKFLVDEESCPHILVSTHYESISGVLPQSRLIENFMMSHAFDEAVGLVYLYKIVRGISTSCAFDVAIAVGLDESIIEEAEYIAYCLLHNRPIVFNDEQGSTSGSDDDNNNHLDGVYVPMPSSPEYESEEESSLTL